MIATSLEDVSGDVVTEQPGEGVDTVQALGNSWLLGNNLENLLYIGSSAFSGTGNALANTITGGDGADSLYGLGGADRLEGGLGNDTLDEEHQRRFPRQAGDDSYLVTAGDVIIEKPGEGSDTVRVELATWTLGANLDNLFYAGGSNFIGSGDQLDNLLTGGAKNDLLSGGAGNDTLNGGAGNDTLNGGTGPIPRCMPGPPTNTRSASRAQDTKCLAPRAPTSCPAWNAFVSEAPMRSILPTCSRPHRRRFPAVLRLTRWPPCSTTRPMIIGGIPGRPSVPQCRLAIAS